MAKASISICKGKGSLNHNNREFITENVDKDRTVDNITYKRESLIDAYTHCFGQAIEEYNQRQKRSDRRINGVRGYMEQIRNSGNGEKLFYENVVQVGNMFDSHVGTEQGELCKQILDEYMTEFQHRNPNLYVFNAVLHMDEQTPHLHIDYIPLAHGYKNGLSVRNSLDRAFGEQGFDGKANKYENRTLAWQRAEKDRIQEIMLTHGLERSEDKGLDREHLTVEQYKAVAETVRNEVKAMPKKIETAPMLLNKTRVTVRKDDLERLEHRAKLSLVHEKATKKLVADIEDKGKGVHQYNAKKMAIADDYLYHAEKELAKATEERKKASDLYRNQQGLREDAQKILGICKEQEKELESLRAEVKYYKSNYEELQKTFEQKIAEVTAPLKAKIETLEKRLRELGKNVTSIVKAINVFQSENSPFRVNLRKGQIELLDGIRAFARQKIDEKIDDLELAEQYKADLDSKTIVKGIQKYMPSMDTPRNNPFKQSEAQRSSDEWER